MTTIVAGLWGPDGYEMTITGGDIKIETPQTGDTSIVVTAVKPLQIAWKNMKSGTTGVSTSAR